MRGRGESGRRLPGAGGPSRRTRRALVPVLLAALVGLAAGCVHLGGLFAGTGPGAEGSWDARLRTALASGRHERALALVGPDSARAGDDLLRLQHEGLVAHYAGRWRRSSEALERAFALAEDRYTKSVSRALLSVVTSDRVLAYDPPHPERLLFHYYGALNYLRRGDPEEAAVEARRLGHLLGRSLDGDLPETPPGLGRTLSLFAAAVFEAAGLENEAAVARRRARAFGEGDGAARPRDGGRAPPGPAAGGDRTARAPAADSGQGSAPADSGDVVVMIERGFVAHREGEAATLFLLPGEVRRLRTIRRRARAGGEDADLEEAVELARRVEGRSFGRGHRRRGLADLEGDPVLVRVAWPVYRESGRVSGAAALAVDGEPAGGGPAAARADLSAAVREAYEGRRALDIAKALLRAAAKEALARSVEDELSEEDETLGEIVGWTARIAGALVERADTRSWHLLPERLELHRLRLPAGTHRISARTPGGELAVDTVRVEPGRTEVVSARAWR